MQNQPSREPKSILVLPKVPVPQAFHCALQRACAAVGGQKSLARRIGVSQSMVWYWLARSKRGVPGEFVLPIEAASGISRHVLRPDIYPPLKPIAFSSEVGTGSRTKAFSSEVDTGSREENASKQNSFSNDVNLDVHGP
jgi:DNA-binding transcriptional regulator YdaS (Cro superfamily)